MAYMIKESHFRESQKNRQNQQTAGNIYKEEDLILIFPH